MLCQPLTAMLTVSLSELKGFSKSYLDVVKGYGTDRDSLVSKMRAAARPITPGFDLVDVIKQQTPSFARSLRWEISVEMIARERPLLILAMPHIGCSGGSMAQLLKCITAARLARELEIEGLPAVPLCWWVMSRQGPDDSLDGCGDSSALERAVHNLTIRIRYLLRGLDKECDIVDDIQLDAIEKLSALARGLLAWAGRELGWLVVDSGNKRLRTGAVTRMTGPMNGGTHHPLPAAKRPDPGGGQAEEDNLESMAVLAPNLPIGAIVVGPDDCPQAVRIADRVEPAGYPRPVLFPRLSATVLGSRDCRVMRKYGLRLVDLLVPAEALQAGSVRDQDFSAIAGGIDAVLRSVETAAEQFASGVAARPRLSRRIQAAGARIAFQVRKLEARAKAACEDRRVIRDRQVKRLRETAAPEGRLQEDCFGTVEFLERFSLPGVSALYQRGDIWNCQHQLICLDENI